MKDLLFLSRNTSYLENVIFKVNNEKKKGRVVKTRKLQFFLLE